MRLAHLADTHLGFRQYQRLTPRGRNQRESDVALAFERAISGVIAQHPDVVVVAGDVFDAVRPTNAAILAAVRQFSRLRTALPGVPVVVIAGNHDTPRSTETTSIFGLLYEIGVTVAADRASRLDFPDLDLSILAVPHQAMFSPDRIGIEPHGPRTHQVLLIHGETVGLFSDDRHIYEPGGALLSSEDLHGDWSYVALGHYHVQREVAPWRWYAGALDYVSNNPWGELREERDGTGYGKGWLLVDLDRRLVTPQPIELSRRFVDLPWLHAEDHSAPEVDRLIADAVNRVRGGITDAVVRQVVLEVARPVARELNHAAIRKWKAEALHFHLDLRRPALSTSIAGPLPGMRRTLSDMLSEHLRDRNLPPGIDSAHFVERGLSFLQAADADAQD